MLEGLAFLIAIFLSLISIQSHYTYPCLVHTLCDYCTYTNICGSCALGYQSDIILTAGMPLCFPTPCGVQNCAYCLTNNICEKCVDGYYLSINNQCQYHQIRVEPLPKCSKNCLICPASNPNICTKCAGGYELSLENTCYSSIPNLPPHCKVGSYPNMCRLCQPGFALSLNFTCIPIVPQQCDNEKCVYCYKNNICGKCEDAYILQNINGTSKCTLLQCRNLVPNCTNCTSQTTCSSCQKGFLLNQNGTECQYMVLGCTLPNCIVCAEEPNHCSICVSGFFKQTNQTTGYIECVTYDKLRLPPRTIPSHCQIYISIQEYMDEISPHLQIACQKCLPGYILVGGQCIYNVTTQILRLCSIMQCLYCITDNYCGKCSIESKIHPYTGGQCMAIFSPVKSCLVNLYLQDNLVVCKTCQEGYWNYHGQCFKYFPQMKCTIVGCKYCLIYNLCQQCLPGYNLTIVSQNQTVCNPVCKISNCFQCLNVQSCSICNFGYTLNSTSSKCYPTPAPTNCSSYSQFCTNCSLTQCLNCQLGYILYNYQCCQIAKQNKFGCIQYYSPCSSQCIECAPGLILMQDQCIALPCNIPNCQYCFRSQYCIVCKQGYILNTTSKQCVDNSQYANCTVINPFCASCTFGICKTCINGYSLLNNQCYCSIPNCLQCIGSAFCTKCAFPLVPNFIQGGGCTPPPIPNQACQVQNCSICINHKKCSICAPGFVLDTQNHCQKIQCPASSNCYLCNPKFFICYQCLPGYTIDGLFGQNCIANFSKTCKVQNCAICSVLKQKICEKCSDFYQLSSQNLCERIKCLQNCQLCIQQNSCLYCNPGYFLNSSNICEKNASAFLPDINCKQIEFCLFCNVSAANTSICSVCMSGLSPSKSGSSCIPQICNVPNCQVCLPIYSQVPICLLCQEGYFLNSYHECIIYSHRISIACSTSNCLYCYEDNKCSKCSPTYILIKGVCVSARVQCQVSNCQGCSNTNTCILCHQGYHLSNNACFPFNCQISQCLSCPNGSKTCSSCSGNWSVEVKPDQKGNKIYSCQCNSPFQIDPAGECSCPQGTYFENTFKCLYCPVHCKSCFSQTVNDNKSLKCTSCFPNYHLVYNCYCPFSYIDTGAGCICPNLTTEYNNSCIPCSIQFCELCQQDNKCSKCSTNFVLENNTCICPQPFVLQEDEKICECLPGYRFYNSQCILCNISHCQYCQIPNACALCKQSTAFSPDSSSSIPLNQTCLFTQTAGCLKLGLQNNCAECIDKNLSINAYGTQCISCSIPNCERCSSSHQCLICKPGYQIASSPLATFSFCVLCNIFGCAECAEDDICQLCLPGFNLYYNSKSKRHECIPCPYPCSTCSPGIFQCVRCKYPFNGLPIPHCFTCSIPYCKSCIPQIITVCAACIQGYTLNEQIDSCVPLCGQYCLQCTSDDISICKICQPGYVLPLDGANQCIRCSSAPVCTRCSELNISMCLQCAHGHYLENDICLPCSQNCKICYSFSYCLQYQNHDKLIPTLLHSKEKTLPTMCDPGCKKCMPFSPLVCIECKDGYYLNSYGYCQGCPNTNSICRVCSASSPNICLSCYTNYYLVNGICQACDSSSNCLICSSTNYSQCEVCPFGFILDNNNKCIPASCPLNCLSCQNSTFCVVCKLGYSANSQGVCLPCLSNCRKCSGRFNSVCLECGLSFYVPQETVFSGKKPICKPCPRNCLLCNQFQGCQQCQKGYTLTKTSSSYLSECKLTCQHPCATCSTQNPNQCTTCLVGYKLQGKNCLAVVNCTSYDCITCPFGYSLSLPNNVCFQCLTEHCARCHNTKANICLICAQGYYFFETQNKSTLCLPCPEGCAQCASTTICLDCTIGYITLSHPIEINIPKQCLPCIPPCSSCIEDPTNCLTCINEYILLDGGWKCVKTFHTLFKINLQVSQDAFYMNYEKFLKEIAIKSGTNDTQIITMQNITSTSVLSNYQEIINTTVTGYINMLHRSLTEEAYNQSLQLNNTLKVGNMIGSMLIVGSTLILSGGSVEPPSNHSILPILLGIFIPLGVIIILVIACVTIRKKKKTKQQEQKLLKTCERQSQQSDNKNKRRIVVVSDPDKLPEFSNQNLNQQFDMEDENKLY